MSFVLWHTLVSDTMEPVTHEDADKTYFTVGKQGHFQVMHAGRLHKIIGATVRYTSRIDQHEPVPTGSPGGIDQPGHGPGPLHPRPEPLHNGVNVVREGIPLDIRIFTPDGKEFLGDEVTLDVLRASRDLRGLPGLWTYSVIGRSRDYVLQEALHETVGDPEGVCEFYIEETVQSQSAPPLVNTFLDGSRQNFEFDLYREGTFKATIASSSRNGGWKGSMRLLDPDGVSVHSTRSRELSCEIRLADLGKSRDSSGRPRKWTLQVSPSGGVVVGRPRVTATVLASGRIKTHVLQDRINRMLGPDGEYIQLVGENVGGQARVRLTITDPVAAETIDMHGLLDSQLSRVEQDPGVSPRDLNPDVPYTLFSTSQDLDYGLRLDVSTMKLKSINLTVGKAVRLGSNTPVVRLEIRHSGKVKVDWGPVTLADAEIRDGYLELEIGMVVDPDGTPRIVTWVPDDPFDIDLSWELIGTLLITLGLVGAVTAEVVGEYIEHVINESFADAVRKMFADPKLAPTILMTIFGAHFTHHPVRFEGDDVVFEYVAPVEPDQKPSKNYVGLMGRSFDVVGPGKVVLHPRSLGDTWAADNLNNKIEHIVAIMMENRSFDHVLGYRANSAAEDEHVPDGSDGLTPELVQKITGLGDEFNMRPLSEAGFDENAVGKKTRIPKGVGHELADVQQQLAGRIEGPNGEINDPKGFVDNFHHKLGQNENKWAGCKPYDVLGYYNDSDLPFYAYLAKHYAYCDRYHCSHPGPTLPNRMYSLTGDVQHDRYGFPILDNNDSDNFQLSRAETIYDLLTKRGVSWRVYESAPSVTMLRMFARYANNDTEIRSIETLQADIDNGDLPAFTYIEPAMHHHPQNDDHPDADMWRGQIFLQDVYNTLRSNPAIWNSTLLIITYDEHGGLYDHVIPPIADLLRPPAPSMMSDEAPPMDAGDGQDGGSHDGGGRRPGRGLRLPDVVAEHLRDEIMVSDGEQPSPPDPTVLVPFGVRVPTFVVSPWTKAGEHQNTLLDHCSILKTVLARFLGDEKPFLSDRVRASRSFEAFLSEAEPRNVPDSIPLRDLPTTVRREVPGTSSIVTPPLSRQRMREGNVDYHDISGRLARMLGR